MDKGPCGPPPEHNFVSGESYDEAIKAETKLNPNDAEVRVMDTPLTLLRGLDRGDYAQVGRCLIAGRTKTETVENGVDPAFTDQGYARMLAAIAEIQIDSRFGDLVIDLPDYLPTLPDAGQVVLFNDDGKQSATIALRNGRDLDAGIVRAWLNKVPGSGADGAPARLYPSALSVAANGTELDLTFPSTAIFAAAAPELAAAADGKSKAAAKPKPVTKPPAAKAKPAPLDGWVLTVAFQPNFVCPDRAGETFGSECPKAGGQPYTLKLVNPPPPSPASGPNPVQVTSTQIVADADGYGRVTLFVGKAPAAGAALHVTIAGANLPPVAGALPPSVKVKGVDVTPNTRPVLALGPLVPGQTVVLTTVDDPAKQITYGPPITLTVVGRETAQK